MSSYDSEKVIILKKIIDVVKTMDSIYLSYKKDVDEVIGHKGPISDKVKLYWSTMWFWVAIAILIMSAAYVFLGEWYASYINYPVNMSAIIIGLLSILYIFKLFVLRAKILGKKSLIAKYRQKIFRKLVASTIKKIKKENRKEAIKAQQHHANILLVVNKVVLFFSFIIYAISVLLRICNPLGFDHQSFLDLIAGDWLGGIFIFVYFSIFVAIEFKIELGETILDILITEDSTNSNLTINDTDIEVELKDDLKVKNDD